jgi:hypothetical protein
MYHLHYNFQVAIESHPQKDAKKVDEYDRHEQSYERVSLHPIVGPSSYLESNIDSNVQTDGALRLFR